MALLRSLIIALTLSLAARAARPHRRAQPPSTFTDLDPAQLGDNAEEIAALALQYDISLAAAAHHVNALRSGGGGGGGGNSTLTKRTSNIASTMQTISSCTVPGTFAMTFDDGPYQWHATVQALFDEYGAYTTFSLNGLNWDCIYSQYSSLISSFYAGHLIAQHTNHHYDLTTLTWDEIHDEFWQVELAFIRMFGVIPIFWRPPYGSYNDLVLEVAEVRGYKYMMLWDQDSEDSATPQPSAAAIEATYQTLLAAPTSGPGSLILNHETYDVTVNQVMPVVVPEAVAKGWQLQSVPLCAGISTSHWDWPNWYNWIQPPSTFSSSWTCQ